MMKREDDRPRVPDSRDCHGLRPRNDVKGEISMAVSVAVKQRESFPRVVAWQ